MPPSRSTGRRSAVLVAAIALVALATFPSAAAADEPVPFTESYAPYEAWTERCAGSAPIAGREPPGGGSHPVFVYLTASGGIYDGAEAARFIDEMAARGFVAASVAYASLTGIDAAAFDGKARCVFDGARDTSAVTALCARPTADCSRGILVSGFSQGAYLAARAHNYDSRVRGGYLIGMSDGAMGPEHLALLAPPPAGTRSLPAARLRIINGSWADALDEGAPARSQLNLMTGLSCALTATSCLSTSGSGWYMVQDEEVADGVADHCYFHGAGGCAYDPPFEPAWLPPSSAPWGLDANLDWLIALLALPPAPPARQFGLQATYFDRPDFTAPVVSRVDPAIDFDWGLGAPHPAIEFGDTFSARWTGRLQPRSTGLHTFTLVADEGARLWVGGRLLIDSWAPGSPNLNRGSMALAADQDYAVKLEFREDYWGAMARLRWSTPTLPEQPVPTTAFAPGPYPEPPAPPAPPSAADDDPPRPMPAAPRLSLRDRTRLRAGRLPVKVTCGLACVATIAVKRHDGRFRTTLRKRALPPGTEVVLVPVARRIRKASRHRLVRLAVAARVKQDGVTRVLRARTRAGKR